MTNVMLRPGETLQKAWRMTMQTMSIMQSISDPSVPKAMWKGVLVLTDQRLTFMEEVGMLSKSLRVKESVDLENLIDVSLRPGKPLHVAYQASGTSVSREFYAKGLADVQSAIVDVRNTRLQAIEREKRQSRVQYVLDFSFLKAQMEKGGITVSTIRCPNCQASLGLPDSGTSTRCSHCGANVVAADIFQRMKGLIGDLP